MTVGVAVGSGALVPGRGEGSTAVADWVGDASDEAPEGAGVGADGEGGAAGTATEGVPVFEGGGVEEAGADATGPEAGGAVAVGTALGDGGRAATETVGRGGSLSGPADPEGAVVQPATHRPKMRQAAAIVVVLFAPGPACMTAPRSCPSTCTSNGRTGRPNTTCRSGDGSDKS